MDTFNKFLVDMKTRRDLYKAEEGQGLVEYGLIVALVAVAAIVVLGTLGSSITTKLGEAATGISNAGTP